MSNLVYAVLKSVSRFFFLPVYRLPSTVQFLPVYRLPSTVYQFLPVYRLPSTVYQFLPVYRLPSTVYLITLLTAVGGCTTSVEQPEVVVYTALDAEFSRPILEQYETESGVRVLPKFDVEANKTVGLTQAIMAEAGRPRCDVFWNNEIINTLRLEEKGLLEVYRPKQAEKYPEIYRSTNGNWHGFAARARVLLVNQELADGDEMPGSINDFTDEKWRGRCGLAKPLFGTTATHMACLFAYLGEEEAQRLLNEMKANEVQIYAGNKQVAEAVSAGQIAFGFTDTDDAIIEVEGARPVKIVYPDQGEGQMGTLFIPNTLAIVKGAPHPEQARRLVDHLLTPQIEIELANSASAQIPLSSEVDVALRVETPHSVRPMEVDFSQAAGQWDTAARFVRDLFAGAE